MLKYEIVFSPDERGFYAEIWDTETGTTIKQTKLKRERQKAKDDAVKFINKKSRITSA